MHAKGGMRMVGGAVPRPGLLLVSRRQPCPTCPQMHKVKRLYRYMQWLQMREASAATPSQEARQKRATPHTAYQHARLCDRPARLRTFPNPSSAATTPIAQNLLQVGEDIRLSIAPCHAMPSQCQSVHLPKHASLARFMGQRMLFSRLWHSQHLAIALHQAALQHAQPCPSLVHCILAY